MSEGVHLKRLPRNIEPRRLAQKSIVLSGAIDVAQLSRLDEAVFSAEDPEAVVQFYVDEQGRKRIEGRISAAVQLTCQRCLGPKSQLVVAQFDLAVMWDEDEAKKLPGSIDPWLVADTEADLYSILEEELLLNLPLVAYHENECIDPNLMQAGSEIEEPCETRDNPFSVLAELKKPQ